MKALCLDTDAPAQPALLTCDLPEPRPATGEVLVRVHAAGITTGELAWYPNLHTKAGGARHRAVPGHEFSGVVAAVGEGVSEFDEGDEVYGMNDWFADGAVAEYCLTVPSMIAPKPRRLSHAEAASVPISALTAWQGLFDRAKVQAGETVLIHGGSGAVGLLAIQLARRAGARVVTTASARHAELLASLGATQVIDYHAGPFEEQVRDVDVVFDGVGGETLQRSWGVLKPGGRLVTVASSSEEAPDERSKAAFFIVEPKAEQLREIGALLEGGELQPCVAAVFPLAEAAEAFLNPKGRTSQPGKIVVEVVEGARG